MPQNNDDALLVPCEVNAWVVNQGVLNAGSDPTKTIRRWVNTYSELSNFNSPEQTPFSGESTLSTGIYLDWKLPKGLRHGLQLDPKEPIRFPEVPKRWLVVRVSGPLQQRVATGWVVESNYLEDDTGATFPNPQNSGQILLGRAVPLDQWSETSQQNPSQFLKSLTAVSNGDVSFTAFQSYHQNVFSFYDPLTGIDQDTVSYFVLGWYSDLSQDLIFLLKPTSGVKDIWNDWYGKLQHDYLCEFDGIPFQNNPTDSDKANITNLYNNLQRTVCHGMSTAILWDRSSTKAPPSKEDQVDKANLNLAFGNTAFDALEVLTQKLPGSIPSLLLKAFNQGLLKRLEEMDGEEILAQEQHQTGFSSVSGGMQWTIVSEENQDTDQTIDTSLPDDVIAKLDKLNQSQADLEIKNRFLQNAQWDLYMLWCKHNRVDQEVSDYFSNPPTTTLADLEKTLDPTTDTSFLTRVVSLQQAVNTLQTDIQSQCNILAAELQKLPVPLVLKSKPAENFWKPRDPVVLITGIQSPGLESTDSTSCRVPSQLNALNIQYDLNGAKTQKSTTNIPVLDISKIPSTANFLWKEFLLVDNIICSGGENLTSADPNYFLPSIGIEKWQQPWSPLFLEWKINWHSILFTNWQFSDQTYLLQGLDKLPDPRTFIGRTFLTPQASFSFKSKLIQLLEQHPDIATDFPDINTKDFIQQIEQWDLLSQTLSGLHLNFIHQDPRINRIPNSDNAAEAPLRTAMEEQMYAAPVNNIPLPSDPWSIPPSGFQPVRHGQFSVERLSVIDSFGQAIDIVTQTGSSKIPLVSDALKADPKHIAGGGMPDGVVQLSPRVVQASRLSLDWIDSQDQQKTLSLNAKANPVCGWLLPNYLDQALQIYSPEGYVLGELSRTDEGIVFEPAPYASYVSVTDITAKYPELGNMLTMLQDTKNPQTAKVNYEGFLEVIDAALEFKMFASTRFLRYESALMGRPLALVRAQWQLDLVQLPYSDQAWPELPTLLKNLPSLQDPFPSRIQAQTEDVTLKSYSFPIRLGNANLTQDGLIGYFLQSSTQTNYQTFCSVYSPTSISSYVQLITGQEFQLQLTNGSILRTTLLLDPVAPIHAYSDILPVYSNSLPMNFVDQALKQMAVTFRVGPLLTLKHQMPLSQPLSIRMPTPGIGKSWEWIERVGVSGQPNDDWQSFSLTPSDTVARFESQPYTLIDGWLSIPLTAKKSSYTVLKDAKRTSALQKVKVLPQPKNIEQSFDSVRLEKYEASTRPKALLFSFISKPTDKHVKKLQKWLSSINAMGRWRVERIANTLLIQFQSTKPNKAQEEKIVNTLLLSLKELPEWNDINTAEREGSNLLIQCQQNNVEKYEQILDEVLGIHQPPQTRFCAVS